MNFLRKLFGPTKPKIESLKSESPRNVKLITFLNRFALNPTNENYQQVLEELQNGKSFLLLPSVNDGSSSTSWTMLEPGSTLKLRSVITMDGVDTLLAFSDEEALMDWSKESMEYKAILSQHVITFCLEHNINRIIINVNQKNMFLLERENTMPKEQMDGQRVLIGMPATPLSKEIIGQLIKNFETISAIEEAFQYGQTKGNNFTLIIAFKLNSNTEFTKNAVLNAIQATFSAFKPDHRVGIYFIESQETYTQIKNIQNALFYCR